MIITLKIEDGVTRIILMEGDKERDFIRITEERSLAERLLPEIDALLSRNGLEPSGIKEVEVVSNQADSFTTTRIARAVANAWNGLADNTV